MWIRFLLFCSVFHFLCFFVFILIPFILKSNAFRKRYLWKFCAKNNSFRVFKIKISFSLKICNHVLISLHLPQFLNKNPSFERNTNSSLWSQKNRMILGWICVYQLGNWWNPYIRKFFKTLPCYKFSLSHWPFRFKIHFSNFRMFLKVFQNLYDFPHFLNLNLNFRLS